MRRLSKLLLWSAASCFCCSSPEDEQPPEEVPTDRSDFYFGADLSYVNQVLDKGGIYKEAGTVKNPYEIFNSRGTNLVRLRLWHNPQWTKDIYGDQGIQLYNDIKDAEKSISKAKAQGMDVLLDFHYSDTWADAGSQKIPATWTNITNIDVLRDSVYNYTFRTLQYLNARDMLPDFVQLGNEINCGLFTTDAPSGFPGLNVCEGNWVNLGKVLQGGIDAVRDITENTTIKTKIILHIADPKNVEWWFDNVTSSSGITDFDIIGFSYYPLWHTTITLDALSDRIAFFKARYNKDAMILETAYPWTMEGKDNYNNHFGSEPAINGYPKTPQGQYDIMVKLTEEVKAGGGIGIIYWEPAWISSNLKDLWGTGSTWENSTFFDFDGNTLKVFDYMNNSY